MRAVYCWVGWRHLSVVSVGGVCGAHYPWRSFELGKNFPCPRNERDNAFTSSMKGLPSWFMPLWCVLMPLTSFLLIPSVQGTIPAYMLAFASAFFVLMSRNDGQSSAQRCRYLAVALVVAGIWLLLFCGSQLGHLLSNRHDFGELSLMNPNDTRVVFRSAVF